MRTSTHFLILLLLFILGGAQAQDWPIHTLRSDIIGAWTRGGDLNNDGAPDILVQAGDSILWYENNYPDEWMPHLVDPAFYNSAFGYVDLFDLDSDGDLDVIKYPLFQKGEDSLSWNENLGEGLFWENHFITKATYFFSWMQSSYGDLDGDGDIDIAVGEQDTYPSTLGSLYWLENDGNGGWVKHDLDAGYYWFSTVADIDGDQDLDIIVSKSDVFWLENNLPDSSWDFHLIATGSSSSIFSNVSGNCADMDNDGDLDVVSAFNANGDLVYYENPGWIKRTIFSQGQVLYVCRFGDPDGDGDLDVPYGGPGGSNMSWGWVENPGTVFGWSPHPIAPSTSLQQIPNTFADIDGDGDEDLVSLSFDFNTGYGAALWAENPLLSSTHTRPAPLVNEPLSAAPNPFTGQTEINFKLPESGLAELSMYNILGEKLSILDSGWKGEGEYKLTWRAEGYPPGIYLVRLSLNEKISTLRLSLVNH